MPPSKTCSLPKQIKDKIYCITTEKKKKFCGVGLILPNFYYLENERLSSHAWLSSVTAEREVIHLALRHISESR